MDICFHLLTHPHFVSLKVVIECAQNKARGALQSSCGSKPSRKRVTTAANKPCGHQPTVTVARTCFIVPSACITTIASPVADANEEARRQIRADASCVPGPIQPSLASGAPAACTRERGYRSSFSESISCTILDTTPMEKSMPSSWEARRELRDSRPANQDESGVKSRRIRVGSDAHLC